MKKDNSVINNSQNSSIHDKTQNEIHNTIKNDSQIWKFCFYGFFKNFKFFEPYLLIIFIAWGMDLFQIGILITIQEILTYTLELPSGIVADKYGKKMVLLLCFIFYIISFIFYFFGEGPNFTILITASMFFGLGEAFRTGTHKAMELAWMDKNGYLDYKTFIYGRTRSYSLLGSTISSLISIIFILSIPANKWIFLITIIPYIIDFILIASYPSYMNEHETHKGNNFKEFMDGFKGLKIVFTNRKLSRAISSSTVFNAVYKMLKDYIQVIIQLFIVVIIASYITNPTDIQIDNFTAVILGILYAVFNLVSSFASKNSYKITNKTNNPKKATDLIFDSFSVLLLLVGLFIWLEIPIIVIFLYLAIYVVYNLRRPIVVDYLGGLIEKDQRATILSVDSLIKSILIFIFAPIFGFIAQISITWLFIGLAIVLLVLNRFALSGDCNPTGADCNSPEKID